MAYDDCTDSVTTLYVGRPLDLPPLTAQAAFDAQRSAAHRAGRDQWMIETGRVALVLYGDGAIEPKGPSWPLRRAPGRLRHRGRGWSISIEVEVTPWSDEGCAVGIRPSNRSVPMTDGHRQRRYFTLALAAGDALVHILERRVNEWMADQLEVAGAGTAAGPFSLGRTDAMS